jgi:hypothetical protein
MEGLQIGSALIGGYGAYKTTSRRAAALEEATKDARTAYNARYGINVSREDIPHLDNDLALKTNILRETAGIPSFSKTELSLGLGVPWLAGVVGPNAIDAATSPNEDVRNRAMNNIIPGWNPGSGPGGRDWSALANMGRAGVEGLAMAGAGSYAGKVRKDYPLAAANARGVLGSVEGAKSAPPPPAGPPPSSPPSAAAPPAAPPGVPVGGPAPALQWQRPTFAPWLSGAAARSYYDKFMRENPEASTSAQPPLPPSPPIKNGKGRKSGTSFGRLAP